MFEGHKGIQLGTNKRKTAQNPQMFKNLPAQFQITRRLKCQKKLKVF